MIKITKSEKRSDSPRVLTFGESITLTTWGAIKVNASHFFPSSFQLNTGGKIIYIDPVKVEASEKADYILVTHAHPDHFSLDDIKKLLKSETKIICSKKVARKLQDLDKQIVVVRPKDSLNVEGLKIDATAAYNTKSVFLWLKAHPKSREDVGFILTLNDDIRIYHAGDTDYIPEMRDIENIDIALIPIGGDNLTMNIEEAAELINTIRPKMVVPMHYELKDENNLEQFRRKVKKGIEVKALT